jgi:DNA (cytosine-5)-methyltransferase 1
MLHCQVMGQEYAVVDLFAGPGGLAEGFSAYKTKKGYRPFSIRLSVEKDAAAHATLQLRCFLRQFGSGFPDEYYDFLNGDGREPDWNTLYPAQWKQAMQESLLLELGKAEDNAVLEKRISALRASFGNNTIVIGGPPCQAYSLVGRARNLGTAGYVAEKDARHHLYEEYIRVLKRLGPAAFVMENVKGMLSSKLRGKPIFAQVLDDLRSAAGEGSYRLFALSPQRLESGRPPLEPSPSDFILRSEDFCVPQARHRVIIVGIRSDLAALIDERQFNQAAMKVHSDQVHVSDVLDSMPVLRSGISRGEDSPEAWRVAMSGAVKTVLASMPDLSRDQKSQFRAIVTDSGQDEKAAKRSAMRPNGIGKMCPAELKKWLRDDRLKSLRNNETRSHMKSDLSRYLFAAAYAKVTGCSPKMSDFPSSLAPAHANWSSGKFSDRVRVQRADAPSTTVTSHISKDGHYFIHPDPAQCRSLTVREAARLQTFPDNYYFKGNLALSYRAAYDDKLSLAA